MLSLKILLAEDVAMVRGALVALIQLEPDLTVVADVERGDHILAAALEHQPDVAIIDIDLPGLDGLTAAAQLHDKLPECRTLILTNLGRAGTLRRALAAHVSGYMLKDAPPEQLARAIRNVAAGRRVIDPLLAVSTWEGSQNPLSARETEVLRIAADGAEPDEIAATLHLSVGTVRNYLTNIVTKLNARNRVDAVRRAYEAGWLPLSDWGTVYAGSRGYTQNRRVYCRYAMRTDLLPVREMVHMAAFRKAGSLVVEDLENGASPGAQAIASAPSVSVPPGAGEFTGSVRASRLILWAVLCAYAAEIGFNVLIAPVTWRNDQLVIAYTGIVIVFVLQVFNSSFAAVRWPAWRRWVMLAAQAVATYVPLVFGGKEWGSMAGFLAGSLLLLVPGPAGWALYGAVVASMLVYPLKTGMGSYWVVYLTVSTFDTGLVVYGLSRLSLVIMYLRAARGELAQLAIIRERVRFARDLHDLLGYSLSAITLKAELARRLVSANPGRSRDELAELLDVARQALADVRAVSSGYRNISLSKEASSVASLLVAAGIDTRVEINCGPLDEPVDTVLATVVRESVTNMLRHSQARACSIEARHEGEVIQLRILNDGVPRNAATGRPGGGLENLAARLDAIGGRLTVTIHDGQFDLLAKAPPTPPHAATAPHATAATDEDAAG